jgi:hypothetical protein
MTPPTSPGACLGSSWPSRWSGDRGEHIPSTCSNVTAVDHAELGPARRAESARCVRSSEPHPRYLVTSVEHPPGHYRLRYDRLDDTAKMRLRRAGRMHHLGVGATHARKRVLALADDHHITVTDLTPARSSAAT